MKEFIEARKINPKITDTNVLIQMDWDIPIDKKEKDVKTLNETGKALKIKAFKDKWGTAYKYYKHKCYHEEYQPCTLEEV